MLAGAISSALYGNNPETLNEMEIRGSSYFENLDLSRSSVLSGNYIENNKAGAITDLSGLAPNLYINSYGIQSYGDVITLRGIGNAQLFGDPAVGLYIDGIPQGSTATYSSALFDLESVEVFKGYQGHRFGKNTPGGTINIKSRKAGEIHRSKLSASYATFETHNYRILADGPTSKNSSYYFGLNRSESDGFANNVNPQGNDAFSESWNGRLGFDFTTDDALDIGIGGTWEEFDLGAQPIVPRQSSGNPNYRNFYSRNSAINETGKISRNSQHLSIESNSDLGKIKSTTSRNFWKLDPNILDLYFVDSELANLSQFRPDLISTSKIIEKRENIWEEMQLSNGEDNDVYWSVGLSGGKEDVTGLSTRVIPLPSDGNASNIGGYDNYGSITSYSFDNKKFAIHSTISSSFGYNLDFDLGLRYDYEKKQIARSKTNEYPFFPPVDNTKIARTFEWITPFAQVSKQINEQTSLSLSSSFSRKPGGFSSYVDEINGSSLFPITFEEERIWANEFKLDLFQKEQHMGASFAIFWNEINNFQFEKPSGSFDYFVDNADKVEVKGFEFNFFSKPNDKWILRGAYGMTVGEIKKHTGLSVSGSHDFSGKRIPSTPEQTFNISATNLLTDYLSWTMGLTHIGKIHYLDQTATDTVNDSYSLLNASVAYSLNDWKLNLFGTNLSDEKYYSSLVTSLTGAPGIVGSPRVIGLSVSRNF